MKYIICLTMLAAVMLMPAAALDMSENAVVQVLYDNINALNNEDIDGAMAAISPDSPSFSATRDLTLQLFRDYDIKYKLESYKVQSITPEKALVEIVQVTINTNDMPFDDNRMTAIHELRPYNGQWKIYNTTIENIDYLNGEKK
jgi:hypothetical protein